MKTFKFNFCDVDFLVRLNATTYCNNGTLAVTMENIDPEEDDPNGWEPFGVATVNLPESFLLPENVAFVDENNMPGVGKFLSANKLAERAPYTGYSGFCTYPAYRFFPERF